MVCPAIGDQQRLNYFQTTPPPVACTENNPADETAHTQIIYNMRPDTRTPFLTQRVPPTWSQLYINSQTQNGGFERKFFKLEQNRSHPESLKSQLHDPIHTRKSATATLAKAQWMDHRSWAFALSVTLAFEMGLRRVELAFLWRTSSKLVVTVRHRRRTSTFFFYLLRSKGLSKSQSWSVCIGG